MKKLILSVIVVVAFAAYALAYHGSGSNEAATSTSIVASSTASTSSTKYKDGTYAGSSVDATYGNVQVQVTVKGGKITDVQFLDHPSGRGESVSINNMAMPILTQEAISAQSANVQTVSGATFTSGAFVQSLQSALDKAV